MLYEVFIYSRIRPSHHGVRLWTKRGKLPDGTRPDFAEAGIICRLRLREPA